MSLFVDTLETLSLFYDATTLKTTHLGPKSARFPCKNDKMLHRTCFTHIGGGVAEVVGLSDSLVDALALHRRPVLPNEEPHMALLHLVLTGNISGRLLANVDLYLPDSSSLSVLQNLRLQK